MKNTAKTKVSAVQYPHERTTVEKVDHVEVVGLTSHRSAFTFGTDKRNLRTSAAKRASFGTSMADALAECLCRRA